MNDYQLSFTVDLSPSVVFENINAVEKWWNELEGASKKLDDEFSVQFGDIHYSTQRITELVPGKKVVWLVTDSQLNFLKDKAEWTGTTIVFEVNDTEKGTRVDFTHIGLVPEIECYKDCTKGWDYYFSGSLYKLLTEGKGTPGL